MMNLKNHVVKPEVRRLNSTVSLIYTTDFIENEITNLKTNVFNIYYNRTIKDSYQDLYIMVENLCILKLNEDLFRDLTVLISEFLHLKRLELICYENSVFLHKLKDLWLLYCHKSRLINNVYLYLETYTLRKSKKKLFVWQMCMDMFYDIILKDGTVRSKLKYVHNLIEDERNGVAIDVKLISDIIVMIDKLNIYTEFFENDFIVKSREYYLKQREELLKGDVLEYLFYVQMKNNEEEHRVQLYLKPETESKMIFIIYKILIEEKLETLMIMLESANIFEKCDLNDIITLYYLLVIVPKANENLCKIFSNYMMQKGSGFVFDKNESNLISNLLEFKDRVDEIVNICFNNHAMYVEAVRTCFKKFINQRKYKPTQSLAKFIDGRMREKQIPEDLLDKIMVLFRYIQGKDVFEAYYKRYLAKRLLLGKSSSQDAEKYMISKLKVECGDGFTSKLEGMFRDIDLSDGLNTAFKQRYGDSNFPIEFTAHVLTSSFWPTFTKYAVTLPDKMLNYQTIFQDFYKAKYSGRSLQWIPSLGSCLVKANLKSGNKEFQVSLYQALVMLLFNESDRLMYKNLQLHLNLEQQELRRTLVSLICGKNKLLTKDPPGVDIKDTDEFIINENYQNRLFRIKINQLQYKETDEEQKITEEEVMHDRHLQIDAALVRMMKQNQQMRHNDLITKIFNVLKFPVNPNEIKKRIEILIERDFLARNPDDTNAYYYVA